MTEQVAVCIDELDGLDDRGVEVGEVARWAMDRGDRGDAGDEFPW
jgi:hypothetical protein